MTTAFAYSGTLQVTTCWCGMRHGVPKELYDHVERQHRDGRRQTAIYCPLGRCPRRRANDATGHEL